MRTASHGCRLHMHVFGCAYGLCLLVSRLQRLYKVGWRCAHPVTACCTCCQLCAGRRCYAMLGRPWLKFSWCCGARELVLCCGLLVLLGRMVYATGNLPARKGHHQCGVHTSRSQAVCAVCRGCAAYSPLQDKRCMQVPCTLVCGMCGASRLMPSSVCGVKTGGGPGTGAALLLVPCHSLR
ncbi:hypothetical protein COO60DRAFT_1035053 [Scenedesmus sp. NREL 46B-D3]|nr:hypothetical protein COO60DRAFT_1035053 [Scenedesmus sp. NREL 46B-D3]